MNVHPNIAWLVIRGNKVDQVLPASLSLRRIICVPAVCHAVVILHPPEELGNVKGGESFEVYLPDHFPIFLLPSFGHVPHFMINTLEKDGHQEISRRLCVQVDRPRAATDFDRRHRIQRYDCRGGNINRNLCNNLDTPNAIMCWAC